MIYVLYDILLHALFILGTPYFILKMALIGRWRAGIPERFGFISDEKALNLTGGDPVIWLHAVSVGEAKAAIPVLKALKARHPGMKVVFSTVTETGQGVAAKDGAGLIDALIYFPFDLSWAVRKTLRRLKPRAFVAVEKEIWPNLIKVMRLSGVPVIVINGTLSERSLKRYNAFGVLFKDVFSSISAFAARTNEDLQRALEAGVREDSAVLTGNIKFGLTPPSIDAAQTKYLRGSLGIASSDEVIVAGSTHEGEEEIILGAFLELRHEFPALKLILAPRHPERFDSVEALIRKTGLQYGRRSQGKGGDVILLDTIGELMTFYSLSSMALVGGSLVEGIGGHNLLEPACFRKPVLYGPHLTTYRYMADMLEAGGGGITVDGRESLKESIRRLLKDASLRTETGENARKVLDLNRGSVEKTVEVIERFI